MKRVIQHHHISYDPEIVVPIYKGEHWVITQLQRRKYISKGFIKTLKHFIAINEDQAQDLSIESGAQA